MIISLIVYGLLILIILSWNHPQKQLKQKRIYEQNGRGYIQSHPFCRQNKKSRSGFMSYLYISPCRFAVCQSRHLGSFAFSKNHISLARPFPISVSERKQSQLENLEETMLVLGLVILFSLLGLLLILFWPGRTRSPYVRRTVSNRNGTGWRPLD